MKKKLSKRTKKDWRKHSDIKDVEEYLESCRRDERLGITTFEKTDSELYFVHTETGEPPVPVRTRRSEIRKKPLRSDLILLPKTGIEGFPPRKRKDQKVLKQGRTATDENFPVPAIDSSSDEEYTRSISYHNIKCNRIKKILSHKDKILEEKASKSQAVKDLWEEEVPSHKIGDEHYLRVTRKKEMKKPRTMSEVPSLLRSVELPHPGTSYNPAFTDHQELLRAAVEVEQKRRAAVEKLQRKLKLSSMSHLERERVWMEEMREGIGSKAAGEDKVEEERDKEEEEAGGSLGTRPIRAEERKTRKQRRREMIRRKEEWLRRQQKTSKLQMDQVYRLRSIRKEILKKEAVTTRKKARLSDMKRRCLYGTRRLGKLKFVEPAISVKLSSELTGSLRTLKCEGSLAMDRYKSLQKRNIVEPRQLVQPRRKYKLVAKEKRSAKLD